MTDPVEAFADYVLQSDFALNKRGEPQALRESSVTVYRARWGKFVADCLLPTGRSLKHLTTDELQSFLSDMTPASRHRYVQLLERVFDHLTELDLIQHNPARVLGISTPTRSNQGHASTAVLSPDLQIAFLDALPEPVNWKRQRDRALISVILGAGLRVAEVIKLTTDQLGELQDDGSIPLEVLSVGAVRQHMTRIQAFATAEVLSWRNQRSALSVMQDGTVVPGQLLFPADGSGRALHPATIYRRVASVLSAAGIPETVIGRRGARTLRSTYAVRELAAGTAVSVIGEAMGHANDRATLHYLEIAHAVTKDR